MKITHLVLALTLGLGLALFCGGRASAAASCSVSAATMPFGNYDVYGAAVAVSGNISITCSNGGSPVPSVTLNAGAHGTIADRKMLCASGACTTGFSTDVLHYNLYTTAAHTTVWGATGQTFAGCNNATCSKTVFGLIPKAVSGGNNDSAVGGYTDSVGITVNY